MDITRKIHAIHAKIEAYSAPLLAELALLEGELRKLIPDDAAPESGASTRASAAPLNDDFDEPSAPAPSAMESATAASIPERVLAFLSGNFGKNMDAETIAFGIGGVSMPTLRSTLQRLEKQGRVSRPHRGLYTARQAQLGGMR